MLRFVFEASVAIGLSLLVATSPLGWTNYLVLGAIFATIGALLIYSTHGLFRNVDSAPTPIWLALTLGLCAVLGALWPALPLIFFYEQRKAATRWPRVTTPSVIAGNAVEPARKTDAATLQDS